MTTTFAKNFRPHEHMWISRFGPLVSRWDMMFVRHRTVDLCRVRRTSPEIDLEFFPRDELTGNIVYVRENEKKTRSSMINNRKWAGLEGSRERIQYRGKNRFFNNVLYRDRYLIHFYCVCVWIIIFLNYLWYDWLIDHSITKSYGWKISFVFASDGSNARARFLARSIYITFANLWQTRPICVTRQIIHNEMSYLHATLDRRTFAFLSTVSGINKHLKSANRVRIWSVMFEILIFWVFEFPFKIILILKYDIEQIILKNIINY